ncbi:glycosyltransferase family 4 protein [Zavarzinia sp. CC-PAN008]|uniref:glycosyltransferase family 4 protein n=1 Tax=Zavarzinia sp. CC-PAN008 TaxID=3243332 RepID=UPI003F749685
MAAAFGQGRTLLFLVTEDWYFASHRLPLARAAVALGFDVVVATRVADHGDVIAATGARVAPLRWSRGLNGPLAELRALGEVRALYRRERPALCHHVALKPCIFGTLAAGRTPCVNAVMGLGYAFTADTAKARALRAVLRPLLRLTLGRPGNRILVQNPDDRSTIAAMAGMPAERIALVHGSGVALDEYAPRVTPRRPGPLRIGLAARMLQIKGIDTAIAAQQELQERGVAVELVLAGQPDPANLASFDAATLTRWASLSGVAWHGQVADMPAFWRDMDVALLPSRGGEGVPKTLIEAAASGLPLVATDVPGCREIARPGESGLLVPPGNAMALADALASLAHDADLRARLGQGARALAARDFGTDSVVAATVALWRQALDA